MKEKEKEKDRKTETERVLVLVFLMCTRVHVCGCTRNGLTMALSLFPATDQNFVVVGFCFLFAALVSLATIRKWKRKERTLGGHVEPAATFCDDFVCVCVCVWVSVNGWPVGHYQKGGLQKFRESFPFSFFFNFGVRLNSPGGREGFYHCFSQTLARFVFFRSSVGYFCVSAFFSLEIDRSHSPIRRLRQYPTSIVHASGKQRKNIAKRLMIMTAIMVIIIVIIIVIMNNTPY